ncbi:MAG: SpoIIIAC/SpoIIIAD family protein [Candidatus Fimivivens sp.]
MQEFFAVLAAALMAMLLAVTLRDLKKEYALLLSLICGILLLIWGVMALEPVVSQMSELLALTQLNTQYSALLLKALGIAICTQLASDACKDAGETAISSKVEFCGKVCLLALSLPLFEALLQLATKIFSA